MPFLNKLGLGGGKYDWTETAKSALPFGIGGKARLVTHASEPAQSTNPDFLWEDNGSGGINYFAVVNGNKTPISNEVYNANTGIDTNQLEAAHYQEWVNAQGGGDMSTQSSGGTSGGGTAPAEPVYVPEYKVWNGVQYEVSKLEGAQAYTNAVNDTILTNYKAQQKKIEDLYASGIIGLDEKLQMGRDNLKSLKKSRDDSMRSIHGYFNRISPDAVQSEQNTLQGNVETEYGEKKNRVGTLFDGKSASEIAGMDLNPYINEISTTGQIARAAKGLNTQKADQITANDQYKMSATDQTANNLLDLKNNISAPSAGDIVSEYMNRLDSYGAGGTNTQTVNAVGGQTTDQFGNPINPDDDNYWNS
jgi:hypothetical protein